MVKKKPVKELLSESLEEILKSKSFEKVTVNEITENCGVGRRTFYNNFTDKYELATWLYIRQLNDFFDKRQEAQLLDFLRHATEVVAKDRQIIIELDKYKGQNSFRDSLIGPMTDIYVKVIEKYYNVSVGEEMRLDIGFYVGGQITYVGNIINDTAIHTTEETMGLFLRCIPESLKQFLE